MSQPASNSQAASARSGLLLSTRPCPAGWCLPPSGRVRLLPHRAVTLGPGWCGATVTTGTGRVPVGAPPSSGSVDGPAGLGAADAAEVARWSVRVAGGLAGWQHSSATGTWITSRLPASRASVGRSGLRGGRDGQRLLPPVAHQRWLPRSASRSYTWHAPKVLVGTRVVAPLAQEQFQPEWAAFVAGIKRGGQTSTPTRARAELGVVTSPVRRARA
jgi:hypothetical protein